MLGQEPGNNDYELVEPVEIGDLSMWPEYIPINDLDQPLVLELFDGAPERRPAAAEGSAGAPESLFGSPDSHTVGELRLMGDLAGFRVHQAVVSPEPEEPQYCGLLGVGEAQRAGETLPDVVPPFKE